MTLLLKNASYINWKTLEFIQCDVWVEQGMNGSINLLDVGSKIIDNKDVDVIDCTGKLVMKSFAVGHHHAYSALAIGMPAPQKAPGNFYEILQYVWWKLDKVLDKEMIKASAYATALACAKAGVTFVVDHHSSPNYIDGSLEILAGAFEEIGINHLLCYEITDRDGLDKAQKGLEETEKYLKKKQALVGLHASFTVSNDTMRKAVDLMSKYNTGIHMHVAEDKYDQVHSAETYHKRVVERLNDYGILNSSKTILAHCLHLSDNERNIIKKSKAFVVQNMESNLNNKVGFFSSKSLGDRIMLGTDGMHSDMIKSTQASHFAGQSFDDMIFGDAWARLRKAHDYLRENSFTGDSENNLVVFDYPAPTPINQNNFLGHFLFGFSLKHVQHVIANGKLIVKNDQIQGVDDKQILEFTKEQAKRLWKSLNTFS